MEHKIYEAVVHTTQLPDTDPDQFFVGMELYRDGEPDTHDVTIIFHPKQIEELYVYMKMRQFDLTHKDIFTISDFKK